LRFSQGQLCDVLLSVLVRVMPDNAMYYPFHRPNRRCLCDGSLRGGTQRFKRMDHRRGRTFLRNQRRIEPATDGADQHDGQDHAGRSAHTREDDRVKQHPEVWPTAKSGHAAQVNGILKDLLPSGRREDDPRVDQHIGCQPQEKIGHILIRDLPETCRCRCASGSHEPDAPFPLCAHVIM